MFTSQQLVKESIYSREDLRQKFGIKDATLNNGIFQPKGYQSIWLFITEQKSKDRTQYTDQIHEDTLYWDGQMEGHRDKLIIDHQTNDLEILIFYRKNKHELPNYGFKYEGQFRYVSHTGSRPTHFILQRVDSVPVSPKNDIEVFETKKSSNSIIRESPGTQARPTKQLRLFYCYARADKILRDELDKHLTALKRQYQIVSWSDWEITPGTDWAKEINTQLNAADFILLLVSPDFMASDYCYGIEMQRAIERHAKGEARVIPVILRPISWQDTPLGKLQALPTDGIPVVDRSWYTLDYALHDVEIGLKDVIKQQLQERTPPSAVASVLSTPPLASGTEHNLLIFKRKDQEAAYREWVLAHQNDGLIVVKDGPRWKVHHATCHHIIDPIGKGQSLLTYHKICSISRAELDKEAEKQSVNILTTCYCQQ